jgi:iron only hydrogenase large subunit-like protein
MWRKRQHLVRRRSAAQIMSRLAPVQSPQQVLARYRHLVAR